MLNNAERNQRDRMILDLRSQGLPLVDIAKVTGISVGRVSQIVTEMIASLPKADVETYRKKELFQLDVMEERMLEIIKRRDVKVSASGKIVFGEDGALPDDAQSMAAAQNLLKIQDRRAKLLGLDAPTRIDTTVNDVTAFSPEMTEKLEAARAKAAAQEASLRAPIATEAAEPTGPVAQ